MAGIFRLLRASGSFERRSVAQASPSPASALKVSFSRKPRTASEAPWTTVVIGKNGIGKSRLLAGVAELFEAAERTVPRSRLDDLLVSKIEYLVDNQICEIELDQKNRLKAKIDGLRCKISELPLPTKIIALTTTPFDKFRISRNLSRSPSVDDDDRERYSYLGLRDHTGRASPTAAIFRALEVLFEASKSDSARRLRVAEVFNFLGYHPHIEVQYDFLVTGKNRLEEIIDANSAEELLAAQGASSGRYLRPAYRILDRRPHLLGEIQDIGREILARTGGGARLVLRADFGELSDDQYFFRRIQLLRKMGLIRMRAVEIQRIRDGAILDLKQASSGELGIVTGFLGLASVIEDGSLVFIDEPEISLHPEWQVGYIDLLLKTFGNYSGCHFVLATHSPLILSDIHLGSSNVVSLDPTKRDAESAVEYAGRSADQLLAYAFGAPGQNNLFVKQEIIRALRLAADGKASSQEFSGVVTELRGVLKSFEKGSPIAKIIGELSDVMDSSR